MYKQDTENSFVDNVCCIFEDNYILWIILIFHPGYTSLILETVLIKLGGRGAEGREKQIPTLLSNLEFQS